MARPRKRARIIHPWDFAAAMKNAPCGAFFIAEQATDQPFRQALMKALRSAPFSSLAPASALQAFILSCCADEAAGVSEVAGIAGVATSGAAASAAIPEPNT